MYTSGCLYCYMKKRGVIKKDHFDLQQAIQDYSQLTIVRKVLVQVVFSSHLWPVQVMIEPETREIPQALASGIKWKIITKEIWEILISI